MSESRLDPSYSSQDVENIVFERIKHVDGRSEIVFSSSVKYGKQEDDSWNFPCLLLGGIFFDLSLKFEKQTAIYKVVGDDLSLDELAFLKGKYRDEYDVLMANMDGWKPATVYQNNNDSNRYDVKVYPSTPVPHKKRPRVVAKSKLDRIKLAWKMLTKGWIYVRE